MSKCYFLVDNTPDEPHGYMAITMTARDNVAKPLDTMITHYDDFSYRDFYHVNRADLLPKDSIKFIFDFVHLPEFNTPNISGNAKKMLAKDPNVFLVIFSPLEYRISSGELALELDRLHIPKHKVFVLTSNLEAHDKILHGVKYIAINFWESFSRFHHKLLSSTSFRTEQEFDKNIINVNKKFLSLNRNVKPHRIWWMYAMHKAGILDQGYVSYHLPDLEDYHDITLTPHTLRRIPIELHTDYKFALKQNMYTRKLDKLDEKNLINYKDSIKHFYNNSVLSVVTESESSKNFITEKTFKAIMHLHPFFIVGHPDQHTLLRARGYETFEDLFGVDCVMDYQQGIELCNNIASMDIDVLKQTVAKKYKDKLLHNQQLFLSRKISWNTIVDELLDRVRVV